MEKMESYTGYPRPMRSGYEPSDTETEFQERPRVERTQNNSDISSQNPDSGSNPTRNKRLLKSKTKSFSIYEDEPLSRNGNLDQTRNKSPLKLSRKSSSRYEDELRLEKADLGSEQTRIKSPLKLRRRQSEKFEDELSSRARDSKESPPSSRNSRVSEKSSYSHRSQSAPKPRYGHKDYGQRNPSPMPRIKERETNHRKNLSVGELNEKVANAKISRTGATNLESTESVSQGDIFFSKEYSNLKMATQKTAVPNKNNGRFYVPHKANEENGNRVYGNQRDSSSVVTTRTTTTSNSSFRRQSSDMLSTNTSSKLSLTSSMTTRFVANSKKIQAEPWFSCLKSRTCRNSNSTEKVKEFDETTFINKAFVVENLRQLWADKHQPASLDGFTCHKQEAQSLEQLVSRDIFPHILLSGPRGSGKKALTMALLHEIFGDSARDISHDLRYFYVQNSKSVQVVVHVASSAHHVELNAYTEPNIRYALISLVKEISSNFALTPDISLAVKRIDTKVIVLYDVDKATEKVQHLIKWIMDCYSESCKLILCCEDDKGILNSVKDRCKLVKVNAPVTHEIMEVLIQISRKEDFDLPMSFAVKIANKSRQNLRQAIMALEACKVHNYPFVDEQPIPLGWEEVVKDLAEEILADPSHTRIFFIRGRLQKLLVEFVHPKLILQGLVEQFLKAIEGKSKRELYYWHAYYEKRLPIGTSALLKLEEFVAKFMSMHRRGTFIKRNIPGLIG